jgi:alpha-glucosidase (family GH31 glycosyl hydrolase)
MIKYLNSKGIRLGLNIDPSEGIFPIENYYEKAKEYLVPDEKGKIPFNIYDSKFIDVYLKLFIHPLDSLGIDFYWIDYFDKKNSQDLFRLKHYQFYDMMRDYKRRPMLLGYNAHVAPHRYPVLYSGKTVVSWDTLKSIPMHNSNAANSGISWWSHDIGGYFKGMEDNELYLRFVELGVFSPIMKFGSDAGKYYKREPWKWSIKTYVIAKDYLRLRHRLIPYLYSEAYKYSTLGVPIIQPLYYKFPEMYDDPIYKNEYYFGGELFVSPIITKKDFIMNRTIHKFYIPEGVWYDITTGKKFPGGKSYVSFFREQDYPVFARGGAIIPLSNNPNLNDTTPPKDLEVDIYPGRSNTYKLYEDDGLSGLYKKGFYLLTSIDYNYLPNNYTVIFRAIEGKSGIVPDKRNYTIRFKNTKKANDVIVYFNNEPVAHSAYVDGSDFIVEIKDIPTIGQLTINCKGKDIEFDAVRLVNEDISKILSDLPIETLMKESIDGVLFGDLPIKKKRIEVRKLKRKGLDRKFVKLFLKLLEYIEQV